MKKYISALTVFSFILLVSLTTKTAFAQQVTVNGSTPGGGQTITVTDQYGGTYAAYLHLPSDYATSTKTYPLLIFLHGMGEAGTDLSMIYNNGYAGGPAYLAEHGQLGKYTSPTTGAQSEFIVLAPQATWFSTTGENLNKILKAFVPKYRVDTTRIYPTGLSAGGQGVTEYMVHSTWTNQYTPAAVIPMSEAWYYPAGSANVIAGDKVYNWGFGSDPDDRFGVLTHNLMNEINAVSPGMARYTNYSGGHCCWNAFYDPAYKETINGKSMNIYEWLLQYARGSAAPVPTTGAPTANAGADQTITLPANSVTLTGSGTDVGGTITGYSWTKTAGGAVTIASPLTANTNITGLTQGTYTFRLTVTDNSGMTATDDVNVVVNAAPIPVATSGPYGGTRWAIPGTIQAEDFDLGGEGVGYHDLDTANQGLQYRTGEGVDIEKSTDGGYNVGWINNGEWTKYSVAVAATGTYTLQARIAGLSAGSMQVEMDGTVIATIALPATGGYQTWQTISAPNVSLTQGNHTMRIIAASNGFNVNYVSFSTAVAPANQVPVANAGADKSITLPTSSVSLSGSGTDADGTIASYAWSQVAGPNTASISSSSSAAATAASLVAGTYTFRLTVTDNAGAKATDDVNVVVNAAPIVPTSGTATFNIDFGASTSQTTVTGWNNVTSPATGTSVALVDATGAATAARLQIADSFYYNTSLSTDSSVNQNGTGASGLYPTSATRDSFFLGSLNGLTDNTATLAVSGLNTTSTYDFRFYASRTAGDSADRTTDYTVNGKTVTLNATNNTSSYADITGVTPLNGSVSISVARDASATFGYLGVLQITERAGAGIPTSIPTPTNAAPTANAGSDKSITLPTSTVSLTGSGTDSDGSIARYAWSFVTGPATPSIASAGTAATDVSGLSTTGTYTFRLTVTDNAGAMGTDDVSVTVAPALVVTTNTNAYGGTPWAIPGTIQAEDFDVGGEGVAYHDTDGNNNGGAYRKNDGVDMEAAWGDSTGGGYLVGWSAAGEWQKYTVNVQTTGTYTMEARVGSPQSGITTQLEVDGTPLATISIPNTGAWQSWQTVTVPNLSLTQGIHVLRVYTPTGGYNLNYLKFNQVLGAYSADPSLAVVVKVKGTLNVRSAPVNGKIIGKVKSGTGGTIIVESPTWPKVMFQNGLSGYVSRAFLVQQIKHQ